MHSFNLATQPWIPVLTASGMVTVTLSDIFDDKVIAIATGDELEDAAVFKLALAVSIAASHEGVSARRWTLDHTADFDLFDPQRPFGQNADMARFIDDPNTHRPILHHSYRHSGQGPIVSNAHHSYSGIRITPAEAARILLVRQHCSVGGAQQFGFSKNTVDKFPPVPSMEPGKATIDVTKADASPYTARVFAWIEAETLQQTLRINTEAVAGLDAGTFHFTWTDTTPPVYGAPTGVLDGLTWLSRSIYLLPGDPVERAMVCDGVRWPEEGVNPGYRSSDEPRLLPFSLYSSAGKNGELKAVSVSTGYALWRQILTALNAGQPEAVAAKHAAAGQSIRGSGIAKYQARIDGAVTGSLPVPVPGVSTGDLVKLVDGLFKDHYSLVGSMLRGIGSNTGRKDRQHMIGARIRTPDVSLELQIESAVRDAAAGRTSIEEARERARAVTTTAADRSVSQLGSTHPGAAGATAAARGARATSPSKPRKGNQR